MGKESACQCRRQTGNAGSIPGSGKSPGGGNGNSLQYSHLKESHGQRSLTGYSPQGHRESDTTERLSTSTGLTELFLAMAHIFCFFLKVYLCSNKLLINHIYWRRRWKPTPVLLPGKSHGRRSLVGCSPWGHEESDTTE